MTNRDIVFRGKKLSDGEWVYGGITYKANRAFIITIIEYCPDTRDWDMAEYYKKHPQFNAQMIEVDPSTVGLYTGREDKKQKDIFYGDILLVGTTKKEKCVVIWDNDDAKFGFYYDDAFYDFAEWEDYQLEVIGNLWDNPELLDGTERTEF